MKRRLVNAMLIIGLCFLTACGGSETAVSDESVETTETEETVVEEIIDELVEVEETIKTEVTESTEAVKKQEMEEDDGIINFDSDGINVTYTKHEISEDEDGDPCLLFYFNFTNNSDEAKCPYLNIMIRAYQNGNDCDITLLEYEDMPDAYMNGTIDVQPGMSTEVLYLYKLYDMSDVTMVAYNNMVDEENKDTQVIVLE